MAPKRKTSRESSSSNATKQQRRFSQRVNSMVNNQGTGQYSTLTQKKKQYGSKHRQTEKNNHSEEELHVVDESTSKENPTSMSIDSDKADLRNQDASTSSYSSTDHVSTQDKGSSAVHFDIADDDSDEFQAMFMSNRSLSKTGPSYSSTPKGRSILNESSIVLTATESASSQKMRKPTQRHPFSTMSNLNMQNVGILDSQRIRLDSSPATQISVSNQSPSNINYTANNHAILETFVEYRTLRRDLQRAEQRNAAWKADYEALTRQMKKNQNNSFPRPKADGRAFLEELLDLLKSCEQEEDTRTSKELAKDIGMPELNLLATSNPDPQKTALCVFNYLFPSIEAKELLINVATLNITYPNLLKNILVWSRRCTPGCGYSYSKLSDAIGNSIRCARHKLKTGRAGRVAATTVAQFQNSCAGDYTQRMSQNDSRF